MSMINSLKMAMGITKAPAKTAAKEADTQVKARQQKTMICG